MGGRKGFTAKHEGCSAMLRTALRAGWHLEGSLFSATLSKDGRTVTFNADELLTRAIGCIVKITSVTRPGPLRAEDPYYVGEHGWRFDVIEKLETPIPCSGAQGLWPLRSLLGEEVGPPRAGRQW
ncbi:hypothetical protein [Nannocystis pusilla]|uniref:hypothetical protein n=1 Tax=Nannocystis pusilla TaxID=889268 RepID=UPI003B75EC1B